ncbi:MAG: alanine racemase, partial [Lentilitoribacter sp.]
MPNKPPSLNTANSDVVDLNCKALGPQITQKTLASYVNAQSEGCLDIPTYIYDVDAIRSRFAMLRSLFGSTFKLSYAIKANPNQALLGVIAEETDYFDASSFAETIRAKEAGLEPHLTSYSGPGKRQRELDAFIGTDAELVIESSEEIVDAAAIASRKQVIQKVLVRINPDHVPRGFGASMSGKPSQFGFDESVVQQAIDEIDAHASLSLVGLHIYTGSNSLSSETLIENFQNMSRLFIQLSQNGTRPLEKLIFGAGFGLPYHIGQDPLDLKAVSEPLLKIATTLHAHS